MFFGDCCLYGRVLVVFYGLFIQKKIFPGGGARKEARPEAIDFASKLRRF